jgi:hypothetical protein
LWRFGNTKVDSHIIVTTRVNHGDRPAGSIATAAVCETPERFWKGKEEAIWFLKNPTYVDDATVGAFDKENAMWVSAEEVAWFLKNRTYADDITVGDFDKENGMRVSADMESIIENGRFHFKETVMSCDPLDETGGADESIGTEIGHGERQDLHGYQIELQREDKGASMERTPH